MSTYQVKDSLGFLVRLDQGILYSSIDTNEYLIEAAGFGDIFGQLLDGIENVTVSAGNFDCNVNESFVILNDGDTAPGRNNELYTDGIGQVLSRQSFVSDPQHAFEIRLINFDFPFSN